MIKEAYNLLMALVSGMTILLERGGPLHGGIPQLAPVSQLSSHTWERVLDMLGT